MGIINIDSLLRELDTQAPCGPNMEYEARFIELEYAATNKPDVEYGDTLTAASAPDWKRVKAQALDLLGVTRDLRIVTLLLRANLALHGFAGLADSLTLVERLLEERWDHVHPQLDPDDGMDPTQRVNSLATLADATTMICAIKDTAILSLPVLGVLSLRMLEIANGEQPPAEGQEKISLSSMESALRDVESASFSIAIENISRCYDSACAIEAQLVARLGPAQALNLSTLTRALKRGRDFLLPLFPIGHCALADIPAPAVEQLRDQPTARSVTQTPAGEVSSREDVLRVLDQVLKYYQQHESSSPVPLLLTRAIALVPKDFMEIMEDLAPESLSQLLALRGTPAA